MGHFSKLNPRGIPLAKTYRVDTHIFNGGYKRRHSRVFKEVTVMLKVYDPVIRARPYAVVDGVLRRDPSTLPAWQRKQGTARADARRVRRQQLGLRHVTRSQAYRSGEALGGTRLGVDRR